MIHHGDCLEVMATFEPESIDAIVTDPPYGLEFMGKEWDRLWDERPNGGGRQNHVGNDGVLRVNSMGRQGPTYIGGKTAQDWHERWAREAYRVAKPGAYLLAFGGTRTYHRLAAAIEDAGWEIRDCLVWAYASGFPKSLDVSKAIDKARGDNPDWKRVGAWLKMQREAAGYTRQTIAPFVSDHKNLESAAANMSNWENGLSCPTWERWEELRGLLDFGPEMDAEVWRLNGRKGTPGNEREVVGTIRKNQPGGTSAFAEGGIGAYTGDDSERPIVGGPATPEAAKWQGWGTALKPAWEPIVMARKPLRGTVAANVQRYGTGALNIDASRIGTTVETWPASRRQYDASGIQPGGGTNGHTDPTGDTPPGRWPANVVLTDPIFDGGWEGVVDGRIAYQSGWDGDTTGLMPVDTSGTYSRFFQVPRGKLCDWCGGNNEKSTSRYEKSTSRTGLERSRMDGGPDANGAARGTESEPTDPRSGRTDHRSCDEALARYSSLAIGYSRFFLIPKADRSDREPVLGGLPLGPNPHTGERTGNVIAQRANVHPTVKPTDLMRHLVRLVTPPGGVVLDPFLGSGSTGLAAEMEGFEWIGIEREAEYVAIATARLNGTQRGLGL